MKHFSWISRIELTDGELDRFQRQIDDTLKYIDVLETIRTENLEMDSQQMEFSFLREDEVVAFPLEVFSSSAVTSEGFVKGPKMK